jgi:hypothetical protein
MRPLTCEKCGATFHSSEPGIAESMLFRHAETAHVTEEARLTKTLSKCHALLTGLEKGVAIPAPMLKEVLRESSALLKVPYEEKEMEKKDENASNSPGGEVSSEAVPND